MSESGSRDQVFAEVLESHRDVEVELLEANRRGGTLSSSSLRPAASVERARRTMSAGEPLEVVGLIASVSAVESEAEAVTRSAARVDPVEPIERELSESALDEGQG